MELLSIIAGMFAVIAGIAAVIKVIHKKSNVGISWLLGAFLVICVIWLSIAVGLEPIAVGISLISGLVSSFKFYRKKSISAKIAIAILFMILFLLSAGVIYVSIKMAIGIFGAIFEGILKGLIDSIFR